MTDSKFKAPSLHFNGNKNQDNPTGQIYMIPQRLADIIFSVLGDASAQIRIMMVLCGTKEEFFYQRQMDQRANRIIAAILFCSPEEACRPWLDSSCELFTYMDQFR